MLRWIFTGVLAVGLVYLCARHLGAKLLVPQVSTATVLEQPGQKLNRLANDPTAKHADRAAAIFALFKHHVKPGDSLQHVRRVLHDTAWVEQVKLYYFWILAGWIPVDMNFEDRTYSLHLFADKKGQSNWVIYFRLAGKSEWGQENEDGIAFLQGKAGSKGESRIKEFALCYPDGRIEFFTEK